MKQKKLGKELTKSRTSWAWLYIPPFILAMAILFAINRSNFAFAILSTIILVSILFKPRYELVLFQFGVEVTKSRIGKTKHTAATFFFEEIDHINHFAARYYRRIDLWRDDGNRRITILNANKFEKNWIKFVKDFEEQYSQWTEKFQPEKFEKGVFWTTIYEPHKGELWDRL